MLKSAYKAKIKIEWSRDMIFIYYAGLFLCSAVTTFSQQKYGRAIRHRTDIWVYALITGIISMLFFGITSGFSILLNRKTFVYALILTAMAIISYFVQLLVYRYMGVVEVAVITMSGKLLLTSLVGFLLFSETVDLISVARIVLMLITVLLIFAHNKKGISKKNDSVRSFTLIGLLLCVAIVGIGVLNTVVLKYVAIDDEVTSSDALFFFTNAMIALFSVLFLLFESHGRVGAFVKEFSTVSAKGYLSIIAKTVAGSASSLLGVLILANGDVSLYSPLSSALGLLATEAVAVFILRERPKIIPMIPAIISIALAFFG